MQKVLGPFVQVIENGSNQPQTGGYDHLRISNGPDRDQRSGQIQLWSRNLSGLPYRLAHEAFGWIGQVIEDGSNLSLAGDGSVKFSWMEVFGSKPGTDLTGVTRSLGNTARSRP